MNYRDYLQQLIYRIINPIVHGMIKIGITPNFITTTGFILNVVAAAVLVYAGIYAQANELVYLGWAGGIILFAGLFDMMDGRVARVGLCMILYSTAIASWLRCSDFVISCRWRDTSSIPSLLLLL